MAPSKETAAVAAPSSSPRGGKDGTDVALSVLCSLLELGVTLTASYLISRWLASKINGSGSPGAGDAEFMADNGGDGSKGTMGRLEEMLVARHEATLRAMAEELEDQQASWGEEKKEGDDASRPPDAEDERRRSHTERQYERLEKELHAQHRQSLSSLGTLGPYEVSIAQGNVIDPSNLGVTFADVGGMDDIKSEIYDLVVLPLLRPDLFMSDSGLVSPPMGILLYGPPGTGKTMLAKAIAKESHATFVNVQLSTIMNKWFGESNKLISATFQLARKLAPSVVFIDEMDTFLNQRDGTEGSAVNSMKSEFLTLWDGLLSERKANSAVAEEGSDGSGSWSLSLSRRKGADASSALEDEVPMLPTPPVIVLGATNRPYDVDPAILRRLPRAFEIPLPSLQSRLQLLQLFLEKQSMTKAAREFLPTVAKRTEGYSGSDLKEVCRAAAWEPVREMTTGASRRAVGCGAVGGKDARAVPERTSAGFPLRGTKARPVDESDFLLAVRKVKKTGESARQFHKKEFLRGREERAATAAEIAREAKGGGGRRARIKGEEGDGNSNGGGVASSSGSRARNGPAFNLDIRQIMAVANAVAAAASVNSVDENAPGRVSSFDDFGKILGSGQEGDDEEYDDDLPPDMSG